MAKRWKRGRDKHDQRGPTESRRGSNEEQGRRDGDGPDEAEIAARLAAVTSRFERPPTAEELRAAFGRKRPTDEEPAPPQQDFVSTYTTESLFSATVDGLHGQEPEQEAEAEDRSQTTGDYYYDPDDSWAVLGLEPGAPWERIAAAHRRLAKLHHPDRLLDATVAQREESEATMRDVNVAYSVLRRLTGH